VEQFAEEARSLPRQLVLRRASGRQIDAAFAISTVPGVKALSRRFGLAAFSVAG